MRLLQIATIILLALNAANSAMLLWTAQSPQQDAAGRGMANGFAGMSITAIVVAAALLGMSYWLNAGWPAVIALLIAILPLVVTVLPVLL